MFCVNVSRLPETCWEVVSHSDWQTWTSCQTEKYFAGPKNPPKKFTVMCIMFSLAFLECFTLVLAIGHLLSPLVLIEVKVIQFSVFSVVQYCICYVFYSVCLEFCCFDDLVLLVNGCMKDVMSLANIYTNNQSCRDHLHKWLWLKPKMYKRGENNENYVI